MPFDVSVEMKQTHDLSTTWGRLRHLADFIENLFEGELKLHVVHSRCDAAHCAFGWAETLPEFQALGLQPSSACVDWCWREEAIKARAGEPNFFGIKDAQEFVYCFGPGLQFRYLDRLYTPSDVARHLRNVASRQEERAYVR